MSDRKIAGVIFALALAVRLSFLPGLVADPAFLLPIVDCQEFFMWAMEILEGQWLWSEMTNHTPLYPYFLAALLWLFDYSPVAVAVVQFVLGSGGAVLVFWLGRDLVGRPAAVVSALLAAGYWLLIHIQAHMFGENLSVLLNLGLLWVLHRQESDRKYGVAGVLLALSVLARPEIMVFAAALLVVLVVRRLPARVIARRYAAFVLPAVLILGGVMVYNHSLTGTFALRSQMGVNLYMGNNPDYRGTSIYVQTGMPWRDLMLLPNRLTGTPGPMSDADKNSAFMDETLRIVADAPGRWLGLIGGKAFSIFTGREFLRAEDAWFFRRHVEGTPTTLVSTSMIFILAVMGMALGLARRRELALLYAFVASGMVILVFPIKTRYLVPVMPVYMLFAGVTLVRLWRSLSKRTWRDVASMCGALLVLAALARFNPLFIEPPGDSEVHYNLGGNFRDAGQPLPAIEAFERAIALDPHNASALHDLGMLYLQRGDRVRAVEHLERAAVLAPHDRLLHRRLGAIRE